MICVLQRVSAASVRVGERSLGAIDRGLLALVAVVPDDGEADVAYLADRLAKLRVFPDEAGRMNLSVADIGGALLLVSQFTLAADTARGNRPGFSGAADPEQGRRLYEEFAAALAALGIPTETGEFGADMAVSLTNDGPVTIWLDTET